VSSSRCRSRARRATCRVRGRAARRRSRSRSGAAQSRAACFRRACFEATRDRPQPPPGEGSPPRLACARDR
jgi:hypothetical protein